MDNYSLSFTQESGLVMIGTLIFIVSFLWKDLFGDIKNRYFPANSRMVGRVVFTAFVSIIIIFVIICLRKMLRFTQRAGHSFIYDDSLLNKPPEFVTNS